MSDVARPGQRAGLFVCWHRSQHDGLDHAVTDEEFFQAREAGSGGRYEALCGHVVLAVSMLEPSGRPCGGCHAFLKARSTLPTVEQRMTPTRHRKPVAWRRLLPRPKPATAPTLMPRQRPPLALERGGRTTVPVETGSAPTAPVSTGRHALREMR